MSRWRVYFLYDDFKDHHVLSELTIQHEGEWTEFLENDEVSLRIRNDDVFMVVKEECVNDET